MIRGNHRDDLVRATARVTMLIGAQLAASVSNPMMDKALAELGHALSVVDKDYERQEKEEQSKPKRR